METNMEDQSFTFGVKHTAYNAEMRKRRIEKGLTQRQLGEICGLGIATISQIEGFRSYPGDDRADLIASALDCDTDVMFPKWLEPFKVTKSSFNTETIITEQLLPNVVNALQLPSNIDDTEEKIDKDFLKDKVKDLLHTLSDREAKVIKMRFGIDGEYGNGFTNGHDTGGKTYEEVGKKFGVTRERVRQIEAKALRKLRNPARRKELEKFIGIERKRK